jgi:hypothetical protein
VRRMARKAVGLPNRREASDADEEDCALSAILPTWAARDSREGLTEGLREGGRGGCELVRGGAPARRRRGRV